MTAHAYLDPRTDHRLPPVPCRNFDRPNLPIVVAQRRDDATENLKDIKLLEAGSQRTIRAFERFVWRLESRTDSDAESRLASLPEVEEVTSPSSATASLAEQTKAELDELTELPQGWDGYNGLPVRPQVAEHARRFMETIGECTQLVPDIVPLSDGGLQLEWFVGAYEVEVAIAPGGTAHVYFECTNDERIEEFPLGDSLDVEKIAPYFRELRR